MPRKVNYVQSKEQAKSSQAISSPLQRSARQNTTALDSCQPDCRRPRFLLRPVCNRSRALRWHLRTSNVKKLLPLSSDNEYSIPYTKLPLEVQRRTVRKPILPPMTVNRGLVRILTHLNSNEVYLVPQG